MTEGSISNRKDVLHVAADVAVASGVNLSAGRMLRTEEVEDALRRPRPSTARKATVQGEGRG